MSTSVTSQRVVRSAAVVFVMLAVAAALVESPAVLAPLEPCETDALARELARCRTVTPDDVSVLEACRRLWAENRQHFFVSTKSPSLSDLPAAMVVTKNQECIQQQEVDQRRTR
jgi:conjugative transfer region protein TrbK